MPSTATITAFYSFSPSTTIRSAYVNSNFSVFRGHLIPVDTTATSSPHLTYDLGATDHAWRGMIGQYNTLYQNTTGSVPSSPAAGFMHLYFKDDGKLYKKNPAGTETEIASAGAYVAPTIQKFTSGSGTYTRPTTTVLYIRVRMVGGGGGGGGSGTSNGTAAGDGGASTFGSQLSAGGGSKGTRPTGGAGGTASLGSGPVGTAINGARGDDGSTQGSAPTSVVSPFLSGAPGAQSALGGRGAAQQGGGGSAATNSGSGGAGGAAAQANSANAGGGGGSGAFIDAIITGMSATFSYAVGSAGSAGGAGGSGYAGGAGAAGYIEVTEFYQ